MNFRRAGQLIVYWFIRAKS